MADAKATKDFSALELLTVVGFAIYLAWMLLSVFWLFCFYPPNSASSIRNVVQLACFAGIPTGFVLLYFVGRIKSFNLFSYPVLAVEIFCSVLLPLSAIASFNGIEISPVIIFLLEFICGITVAAFLVSWLDVASRVNSSSYSRFTALSFVCAVAIFGFAAESSVIIVPILTFVLLLISVCLLLYLNSSANFNDIRAPLESIGESWKFTKEIEPSFFMFGVVFAFTFMFLFAMGSQYVLAGILSVAAGAFAAAVPSLVGKRMMITTMLRMVLVITVVCSIALPFIVGYAQIVCACIITAAWGFFKASNYSFVIKKSVLRRDAPLFRQAPMRLAVSSFGFAFGWLIATIITSIVGAHSEIFVGTRLVMACVLVGVFMVFFPDKHHHPVSGSEYEALQEEEEQTGQGKALFASNVAHAVALDCSKCPKSCKRPETEADLIEVRCHAVAKLYQLSPRESEILLYLVRGRNASWIQEKLVVSPHTAKSHIYNIYKKLDIHSQQKLMSFVEEFPLD